MSKIKKAEAYNTNVLFLTKNNDRTVNDHKQRINTDCKTKPILSRELKQCLSKEVRTAIVVGN